MNGVQRHLTAARPMEPVCDPAGWYAEELVSFGGGEFRFDAREAAALRAAADSGPVGGSSSGSGPVSGTVMFGAAAMRMDRIAAELKDGLGFAVMRGLGLGDAAVDLAPRLLAVIGSHLGVPVTNDGPRSDITMRMCLSPQPHGSEAITSVITIYNEMLARQSELLSGLLRGAAPFSFHDGYLSACRPMESRADLRLAKAFALYDELAVELSYEVGQRPGDILVVNEHVIVDGGSGAGIPNVGQLRAGVTSTELRPIAPGP